MDILHLNYMKKKKKLELKNLRNYLESIAVDYKGNKFQFDNISRQRLYAAKEQFNSNNELINEEDTILWTTENNEEVEITKNDIDNIISLGNKRILELHQKYKDAKNKLEKAETDNDIESITIEL